jgi:hypothetical protein
VRQAKECCFICEGRLNNSLIFTFKNAHRTQEQSRAKAAQHQVGIGHFRQRRQSFLAKLKAGKTVRTDTAAPNEAK